VARGDHGFGTGSRARLNSDRLVGSTLRLP
jgi:hypothetical protein